MDRLAARELAAALRRRLWVAGLVGVLVAAVALVRYAGPGAAARHRFLASQALVVEVLPSDAGNGSAHAADQQAAGHLAQLLATPALFRAAGFERSVASAVAVERAQVEAHFGAGAASTTSDIDPAAIGSALTASQRGPRIVVTASWPTAAGAWALASASGSVLEATKVAIAGPGSVPTPASPTADSATLRVLADGPATAPVVDPAPELAARIRLLETLLLGLFGGFALALVVDAWAVSRSRPAAAESATSPARPAPSPAAPSARDP